MDFTSLFGRDDNSRLTSGVKDTVTRKKTEADKNFAMHP